MKIGKRIVITGASSGIGRSYAEGASTAELMILLGRDAKELEVTKSQVLSRNPQCKVELLIGDFCDADSLNSMTKKIKSFKIDTLILNAGGGPFGKFLSSDLQQQMHTINLNVSANTYLLHSLLPEMISIAKESKARATVIIVASHAAYMRVPLFSVYAACKTYLLQLGQILAIELKDEPVDIQVLCPGATSTQFPSRAGIPPMLSTPVSPSTVAQFSLNAGTGVQIVTFFDKLLYWIYRLGPVSLVDLLVSRIQRKFLNGKP